MELTHSEKSMLSGEYGPATKKAMEILVALGTIYNAERMIPVSSVQISGVSYDNLGEAGLEFLSEMADGGGHTCVITTLNPAGMDVKNWRRMDIDPEFARNQERVLQAFSRMGVITTCTCTPYLIGNLPHYKEHIAWSESSAVCFANSVIGAQSNREGGPSALASALTGVTPEYGYHLDQCRHPTLSFFVQPTIRESFEFSALGSLIGRIIEKSKRKHVALIRNMKEASLEGLKALCASIATYGGSALFHIEGITPEANLYPVPSEIITISQADMNREIQDLTSVTKNPIDFVSLGCPHLSIKEIARIAELIKGKKVKKTFWITTARPIKNIADDMGYTQIIEEAGAIFAVDTCCVVAPIQGKFNSLATDSAKACYYANSKNHFNTVFLPFDQVVSEAIK